MARRVAPLVLAGTLLLALMLPAGSSAVYPDPNPWFTKKFLNIAHQGGEDEAPSETMFALKSAVAARGADVLEIDVNLTEDGHLVVIHDDTVNRTTQETRTRDTGFSQVRDLTLAEIQALDAGYTFTSEGTYTKDPTKTYPYRGVRTGTTPPPAGYAATDFRIPTLIEVLNAFPTTPINIEIKMEKHQMAGPPGGGCVTSGPGGQYCDDEVQSQDIAEELARVLDLPEYSSRSNDFIVVSFSDLLIEHFRSFDDPPLVPLAPGRNDTTNYILSAGAVNPDPDVAAIQIPPNQSPISNVPEFAKPLADADQYAVHVWPNDANGDTDAEYARFLNLGVQGYMASKPGRLHAFLCAREVPRPDGSDRCPPPAKKKAKTKKKCKKLRGKLKRQKRGLGRAGTEAKRAEIQENISDTQRRLSKLDC